MLCPHNHHRPGRQRRASGSIGFSSRCCALSRSQLQRLIKDGRVLVAGHAAKANQAVKPGQEISIEVPELIDAAPQPEALPLPIVYQDKDLDRRRQAGGHGRASGRGARERHAGQRAAAPRRRSERHRRREAARHRAPARQGHVGADGRRQARHGARGAGAPVRRSARSRRNISRWRGAR